VKTILIFHANQQSIAGIQSALAGLFHFYATTRLETAIDFLAHNPVETVVFYLPGEFDQEMKRESVRLLKFLRKRSSPVLTKIVVCSNEETWQVKDWMALGVTAIVSGVTALRIVLGAD